MDLHFRMLMIGPIMQRDIWRSRGIHMYALPVEHASERCNLRGGAQGSDRLRVPLSIGKKHWGGLRLHCPGGVDN